MSKLVFCFLLALLIWEIIVSPLLLLAFPLGILAGIYGWKSGKSMRKQGLWDLGKRVA